MTNAFRFKESTASMYTLNVRLINWKHFALTVNICRCILKQEGVRRPKLVYVLQLEQIWRFIWTKTKYMMYTWQ